MRTRRWIAATCLALGALVSLGAGAPVEAQGLPDLVVRTDILERQWVVREEKLAANFCSVIEGEVTPGLRKLVRFTVMTANVGTADINIGDPREHFEANDGLFELSTCHAHFHFRNYAVYELIDPRTGKVWKAAKRGFCMLDTDPNPAYMGESPKSPVYRNCGSLDFAGNQGISHGWTDTYRFYLGGQYFVLDGGDGQPVVPAGDYIIRITANPPYKATKDNPCRFADANGLCHALEEANYFNNVGQVLITIPDHPGQTGVGPLAGSEHPKTEDPEH